MTSPSHNWAGTGRGRPGTARNTRAAGDTVRWSVEQIRAARVAPLLPILQAQGIESVAREAGNHLLPAHPGLIVKEGYWRWPERDQAGNAIDFHMRVLGLSFNEAMRRITVM